jgi:hypothetical protein
LLLFVRTRPGPGLRLGFGEFLAVSLEKVQVKKKFEEFKEPFRDKLLKIVGLKTN